MGRKAKYSKELKLEVVKRYLNGEAASKLTDEYNIPSSCSGDISKWARRYKALGESAFDGATNNRTYSKELKEMVIKEYLEGKSSTYDLANKYNISTRIIVMGWIKKYNEGIEIKDYDPKGDVYTMKSRKTTIEERLEIVNYVLSNDNDYKGAADKYTVPYANVYNWVKKYNECGEDALKDNRGRPSSNEPKKELTLEEKQALEIEKLKRELERQKMIVEILKKNEEIRKRMERDSRLLNKKTNMKR